MTAEIEVPDGGAEGVLISQGGEFAGWSLYLKGGKPHYAYNTFGIHVSRSARTPWSRRARTRCAWSSHTTAATSAREAR